MSLVDPRAIVDPAARLADDVQVGPWSIIGPDVEIGEGTVIASHVVIKGPTRIGRHNRIFQFSSVGEDTPDLKYKGEPTRLLIGDSVIANHCILVNNTALAGHVHVGDWAILSGYTLVHQYCHIGAYSFSGMGTAIGKDVPAFVTVFGNPAEARSMNFEGMRRRGFSTEAIMALRNAYKVVYRKGLTVEAALTALEVDAQAFPEVALFRDSVRASNRGITR